MDIYFSYNGAVIRKTDAQTVTPPSQNTKPKLASPSTPVGTVSCYCIHFASLLGALVFILGYFTAPYKSSYYYYYYYHYVSADDCVKLQYTIEN